MKDIFALRVGDPHGDGHGRYDIFYYRWVSSLEELECDSGYAAFDQTYQLGRNLMNGPDDFLDGHRMDMALFEDILDEVRQYDSALVTSIEKESSAMGDKVDLDVHSYLKICIALATIGYGAVLPIESVHIRNVDLNGYDMYN